MADIRHRVAIAASQAEVYQALTTTEGLTGWWTRDMDGDPRPGGTLQFFFGNPDPSVATGGRRTPSDSTRPLALREGA